MYKISEATRRNIHDMFVCGVKMPTDDEVKFVQWSGKLDDPVFLKRLYNLDALPSRDWRYETADGDIACHYRFGDYKRDWVFTDDRFELMEGEDEVFLNFICEVFHPAVTRNSIENDLEPEYYLFKKIESLIKKEGYEFYEECRIGNRPVMRWRTIADQNAIIEEQTQALKVVFDSDYIQSQLTQMKASIDSNPSDAIGKAKELVESCCKTILEDYGTTIDKNWDVPKLGKETFAILSLLPNEVDNSEQGAETIKKLLGNLCSIPSLLAELRNPYGTGHGKSNSFNALTPRHARLAVGAASTLCWFLWETYQDNKKQCF